MIQKIVPTRDSPIEGRRPSVQVVCRDRWLSELLEGQVGSDPVLPDPPSRILVISPRVPDGAGLPDVSFLKANLERQDWSSLTHVVLLSSALVYGIRSSNPGLMRESQSIEPDSLDEISLPWLEAERFVTVHANLSGTGLTILRPCTVVSSQQKDWLNRFLQARIAVPISGRCPSLQFLDGEGLSQAVESVVRRPQEGVFNLAPRDAMPLHRAMQIARTRRLPLPSWVAAVGGRPQRLIKFCWTVSSRKFNSVYGVNLRSSEAALRHGLGESCVSATVKSSRSSKAIEPKVHDPFGMEPDYIERCGRGRFRFCEKVFWRIDHSGLDNIPSTGGAVLAGTHRGFMPFDGVMMVHLLNRVRRRIPRFLIHPALVKFGHLDGFLKRIGGILANQDNADWVLENREVLGIFPEGIRGAFKKYDRNIYQLGSFGRNDFVKFAVKHQVPIVPFVSLGPAESFPIFKKYNWNRWKRLTGWPAFPMTATWPLLPIPLPTKWHFQILKPIWPHDHGVYSLEDRRGISELSRWVKAQMQSTIDDMVSRRRSIFFGSLDRETAVSAMQEG